MEIDELPYPRQNGKTRMAMADRCIDYIENKLNYPLFDFQKDFIRYYFRDMEPSDERQRSYLLEL